MHPKQAPFYAEEDTRPGCGSFARPSPPNADRRELSEAPPPSTWRPRPPLESTTYSIIPAADERPVSICPPSSRRSPRLCPVPTDVETISPADCVEIDHAYASLATQTHYELLGVAQNADATALIEARVAVLRRFDPQRFEGRVLGAYRRKLEIIVACVEEAFTTLHDEARRVAEGARPSGE